jgi:hypothetical protein
MGVLLSRQHTVAEEHIPVREWRVSTPEEGRHPASGEAPGGDLETRRLPRLVFFDGGFHDSDG